MHDEDAALVAAFDAFFRDADASATALVDAEDINAFAAQMLQRDDATSDDEVPSTGTLKGAAADVIGSFPRAASFVTQLSVFFATWSATEHCPLLLQSPAADGVSALTSSRDHILATPHLTVHAFVRECRIAHEAGAEKELLVIKTAAFVRALGGARGLLTCLGFRETVGSRTVAPLTRTQCLVSFQQLQSSKEKLTVGARAFTKHCARSSDGFWGEFKGNDLRKNATALAKVEQILGNAVWKNVHSLPHGEATLELRNADGYGARWYIRDQSFRGFLEPHMENGHENRWRH